ncbi:MAG: T9SS type A sorting domain-containing protein [Saprospiraceae bacterium]|nr:T9SS type A sorting domain-containing protein [Saprospiraceae bacterium]
MKRTIPIAFLLFFAPYSLAAQYGKLTFVDFDFEPILVDIDGDGDEDIFPQGGDFPLYWAENLNGDFTYFRYHEINKNPYDDYIHAMFEDFDNDGQIEMIVDSGWKKYIAEYQSGQGFTWKEINANIYWDDKAADMDGDGLLDIMCQTYDNPNFCWYKNLGGGVFSGNQTSFLNNVGLQEMIDFDGDGDIDLLGNQGGGVLLFKNDGTGHFSAPDTLTHEANSYFAVADFGNDGDYDFVILKFDIYKVLENDGNDNFTVISENQLPSYAYNLRLSDTDLDGNPDLWIYVDENPGRYILLATATGPGTFAAPVSIQQIDSYSDLSYVIKDLDMDGLPDVYFGASKQNWLKNLGNNTFSAPIRLNDLVYHKGVADLDHDGYMDTYGFTYQDGIGTFGFNKNNGTQEYHWIPLGDSLIHPVTVDMNGDGLVDVIGDIGVGTLNSQSYPLRMEVWLNDGPATFSNKLVLQDKPSDWAYIIELLPADIDGDGDMDVFAYVNRESWNSAKNISILINDGSGQLAFHSYVNQFNFLSTLSPLIDDLDGDGDPDIILKKEDRVDWMENLGNYNFGPIEAVLHRNDQQFWSFFYLLDYDHDGLSDIVGEPNLINPVAFWKNLGSNTFEGPNVIAADVTGIPKADDFDLDGDYDFFSRQTINNPYGTDSYALYLSENLGNGQFANDFYIGIKSLDNFQYFFQDVDGDGDSDIAFVTTHISNQTRLHFYPNLIEDRFTVKGRTFWDIDGDGVLGAGDYPFTNRKAELLPSGTLIYSNQEGRFYLQGLPGTNHLTTTPDTIWQLTTTPDTFEFELPAPATSPEYLFGFKALVDTLQPEIILQTNTTRCGFGARQWGIVNNAGTTLMSGTVVYTPDNLTVVNSLEPPPAAVMGGRYYFDFENIPPGGNFTFKADLTMPGVAWQDSTLVFDMEVYANNPLGVQVDTLQLEQPTILTCAYDPNDKLVVPAGIGVLGLLEEAPAYFTYTIRFQNTGSDTAFTVRLKDQLHPLLDRATLKPVAASHPFLAKTGADGMLEVLFENILLPDSTTDFTGSQGFFTFTIEPFEISTPGTKITNQARIYFDYNPPIETNRVSSLIGYELSVQLPNENLIRCGGDTLLLEPEILSTFDSVAVHWEKDGEWWSAEPTLQVTQAGQYVVFVTSYGMIVTDSVQVEELAYPGAAFFATANGNEAIFSNGSTQADSVHWDFGNNLTSNEDSPHLTFDPLPDSLFVCMTAFNECGENTLCKTVYLGATGITELEMEAMQLAPNPVRDKAFLTVISRKVTSLRLTIFDVRGREVALESTLPLNLGKTELEIDVSGLPAGLYLVKLEAGQEVVWKKMVLQ